MYQTLITHVDDDGILHITLNRPQSLNALNQQLLEEFEHLLNHAQSESQIKALLITGEGKAFCAGADINQLVTLDEKSGLKFAQYGQRVFNLLEMLGKPSLAAVNGYAFGGGCELTLATTLRIASTQAQFAQPEVKLGVIPCYGGTQRLPRLIGKGRALDLCLTGRTLSAENALLWGLITEITQPEELLTRARAILKSIIEKAPLAIQHIIEVINTGTDLNLPDALQLEASHFSFLCTTEDKQEGVNVFLEKRKTHFQGK